MMSKVTTRTIRSPVGNITLKAAQGALVSLAITPEMEPTAEPVPDPALDGVASWLEAYFAGRNESIAPLGLSPAGTVFQRRVWQALEAIPYGQTRSYGEIAGELGSSARAVGGACRANPLPILVPCHRVVAADGLGGYAGRTNGAWFAIKAQLLRHEREHHRTGS
jgi:methylated-DNA-[protein]-cysteine S-methyltransferase